MPQPAIQADRPRARSVRQAALSRAAPRTAAGAPAMAVPGLLVPTLEGVPAEVMRGNCPGSSEELARSMIAAGIAAPRHLAAETPTDTFVGDSLARWMRSRIRGTDLAGTVCLTCEVEHDHQGGKPTLTLELDVVGSIDWWIGPFVRDLAGRSPTAASTLLHVIERQVVGGVFGPQRTAEYQEFLEEQEAEIRDNMDTGDAGHGDERDARPTPAPPFDDVLRVTPYPKGETLEGLRPWLARPVHDAVARLLAAEETRGRMADRDPPDQGGESLPLYLLFEDRGDATVAAFDDMMNWGQDSDSTARFHCRDLRPATIRLAFKAMAQALRVAAALDALRRLTATRRDQAR